MHQFLKCLPKSNSYLSLYKPIVLTISTKYSYSSSSTTSDPFFSEILSKFPANRSLVFAYGSGVFRQEGHKDTKDNMTDFIFTVNDSEQWHRENLAIHPNHYSSMARMMGPAAIKRCQEEWGARLYFNTLVPWGQGMIKYGVINRKDLLVDLVDWETLYVAGRLHKPVNIIEQETNDNELQKSLVMNLTNALHTALLLLPDKFTEEQLFLTIAGLSYTGDFRMVVGEDRNKVSNIVRPQMDRFRELYRNTLDNTSPYLHMEGGFCEQDMSIDRRMEHLMRVPSGVLNKLLAMDIDSKEQVDNEIVRKMAYPDLSHEVSKAVGSVVTGVDKSQAAKGVLTAGVRKAVVYSWNKVKKMINSWNTNKI